MLNKERYADGLSPLAPLKIKISGQTALALNSQVAKQLHLARTIYVDALIEGDFSARNAFKETLRELSLVYDELSEEI